MDDFIYIIRHADTGTLLCVFENSEDVDAWLDDFDADEQDLLPVTQPKLSRSLYLLRNDKTLNLRLYYFDSDVDEKHMKEHSPEEINPSWIEWWKLNDYPWMGAWDAPEARVPGEWPPEPKYDEDGNLVGEKIDDESWLWEDKEPLPDKDLKDLAIAMRAGTVFSSDHLRSSEANMLGMVFMPFMLGGAALHRQIDLHDLTLFYEHLDQAGPRSINGLPMFFSMRYLNRADHSRLYEKMSAIEKALADV
jgi:hypothetical protein